MSDNNYLFDDEVYDYDHIENYDYYNNDYNHIAIYDWYHYPTL